ncbi:MAG TPA: Mut7-C RNAse domain-containing protein [Bryobacteraceae bacterium]|nr:Mut7-C RNAse domain-containing protein [Bryobacteraceae bacterium]
MGLTVRFRFHGELNDFLPADQRHRSFEHDAWPTDTIKHVIESLGVPHTEIGRVLVNGELRSLSAKLNNNDEADVYPHALPIQLEDPHFVVDGHLGRLAAYLRMLGFDTWYRPLADDAELAAVSSSENRLVLTRDAGLLKRRAVETGYFVRSDKPLDQLKELNTRFALIRHAHPFTRCMACNGELRAVSKDEIIDLLPPHTRATRSEFSRCSACRRIYWRGTHYERMLGWLAALDS